jgi:recombination associated protein RdgC
VGALAGSISTTAYYVEGKLESGFRETFLAGMQKLLFEDISVEGEDTESWGWVNIHDPFDTDLRIDNVHWDAYFLFGLRQDVLRVPASLFKLYLKQRFDAYKAEFGKDRLAKSEKDNMKDLLERELRRKTLPAIKVHDVAWNLDRGELWLFATNKGVREQFEERFDRSFGLNLIPRNAYSLLERRGLEDSALAEAARLEATVFALPEGA